MFCNNFELSLEVGGRRIPEYGHRGRTYVEGRRGYPYTIKFRNSRAERVLVIPSVDGLNVVDGNPHSASSTGYVVQPYGSLTISGWRTSLSEVRTFEFADKSGSYAGKTHGQQNCGVIGVQVWGEHRYNINLGQGYPVYPSSTIIHHHHHTSPGVYTREVDYTCSMKGLSTSLGPIGPTGDPVPAGHSGLIGANMLSCQNAAPDFNLGTSYGAPMADFVSETSFSREVWLGTMEIYYSDAEGLTKDGIVLSKAPELASLPQAFGTFCKPPPY